MWQGDYKFLLKQLILKDFRIRYRNMSLGIFWSLLNPLIMIMVFSYVFTEVFRGNIDHYPVYLLCGVIPFNFFSMAWQGATSSLIDNTGLIKRVPIPREIVPLASILSNLVHLGIQLLLIIAVVQYEGMSMNWQWFWLIPLWLLELAFIFGLALLTSGVNVIVRDTRYIVESINVVLFWLVPVFYSYEMVPAKYMPYYECNPVTSLVILSRKIIFEGIAPPLELTVKFALIALGTLIFGGVVFSHLKARLYRYL